MSVDWRRLIFHGQLALLIVLKLGLDLRVKCIIHVVLADDIAIHAYLLKRHLVRRTLLVFTHGTVLLLLERVDIPKDLHQALISPMQFVAF